MKQTIKILVITSVIAVLAMILFILIKPQKDKQKLSESIFYGRTDIMNSDDVRIVVDKQIYKTSDEILSFYLINTSQETYSYGEAYYIEMLNGKDWSYVIPDDGFQVFDLVLYTLHENDQSENYSIQLKEQYSHLQSGKYRIYKEVKDIDNNSHVIYTEFQIK